MYIYFACLTCSQLLDTEELAWIIKNVSSVQWDRYGITCERFIIKLYSFGYKNDFSTEGMSFMQTIFADLRSNLRISFHISQKIIAYAFQWTKWLTKISVFKIIYIYIYTEFNVSYLYDFWLLHLYIIACTGLFCTILVYAACTSTPEG